jgi:hypothetical protein
VAAPLARRQTKNCHVIDPYLLHQSPICEKQTLVQSSASMASAIAAIFHHTPDLQSSLTQVLNFLRETDQI